MGRSAPTHLSSEEPFNIIETFNFNSLDPLNIRTKWDVNENAGGSMNSHPQILRCLRHISRRDGLHNRRGAGRSRKNHCNESCCAITRLAAT
jgi:hypothetical protein